MPDRTTDLTLLPATTHFLFALQLAIGFVFLVAAVSKLRRPRSFSGLIRDYNIVPSAVVVPTSTLIVAVEFFLAVALVTGAVLPVALPLAVATLVVFAVAVSVNLRRGRLVRCGCFGDDDERISGRSVARLGEMLLAAIVLMVANALGVAAVTVDDLASAGFGAVTYLSEIAPVAAFLVLVGLWMLHLPELSSLVRMRRAIPSQEG